MKMEEKKVIDIIALNTILTNIIVELNLIDDVRPVAYISRSEAYNAFKTAKDTITKIINKAEELLSTVRYREQTWEDDTAKLLLKQCVNYDGKPMKTSISGELADEIKKFIKNCEKPYPNE